MPRASIPAFMPDPIDLIAPLIVPAQSLQFRELCTKGFTFSAAFFSPANILNTALRAAVIGFCGFISAASQAIIGLNKAPIPPNMPGGGGAAISPIKTVGTPTTIEPPCDVGSPRRCRLSANKNPGRTH